MEQTAGGGGGGGGPAPFLIKTYEMVDDSSTDEIVSWSSTNASFVVWNPPDFAAKLLPAYFKHNNFSSFIRQLNTYGFRKIDPERWEFATEGFLKDHKHLLKNIHRRKPIHSHSHSHPSLHDSERIALEEEIDRLSREKAALTSDLWRFKQQQSGTKIQLEDLERRVYDMERRQAKMVAFLDRALHNPNFVDNLITMAAASGPPHFSSILHKKRRLPALDYCLEIADSSFCHNSNTTAAAASNPPDAGQVFNQDFCDKLKLGLYSGAISNTNNNNNNNNPLTATAQSSSEAGESPRVMAERNINGNGRLECLSLVPDALQLSDTGTSICPRRNSLFSGSVVDDGDALISCHLNLTLASSSMQIDRSCTSQNSIPEEAVGNKEEDTNREATKNQSDAPTAASENATSLHEAAQTGNQGPPAPPGRVNDVFWEQFLTERPGSSDTEEASSGLRGDPSDESREERKNGNGSMWKNRKDMEQLTL